jgi:hypothetical protein
MAMQGKAKATGKAKGKPDRVPLQLRSPPSHTPDMQLLLPLPEGQATPGRVIGRAAGRPLGCTKCRFKPAGCARCRKPDFKARPRGPSRQVMGCEM